jgi:hypothetical protein
METRDGTLQKETDMKWIIGFVLAAIVLGAAGYAVYRWTDVPEQAEAWMNEQDLKNFPTQARREVADMKAGLDKYKQTKKELQTDIIKREGVEDWSASDLKDTLIGYDRESKRFDEGIREIVKQVRAEQQRIRAEGVVINENGEIPGDYKYTVVRPDGTEVKLSEADARADTDRAAIELQRIQRKRERQQRIVEAKKQYVTKLDDAVTRLEAKIGEMDEFIEDMETELELLKIEEDIAAINASLAGENDSNQFGKTIRLFRDKKKEFLAEQELASREAPATDDSYFKESDDTSKASSASYWN